MNPETNPEIKTEFENALKRANDLPNQGPKVLLELYGLFKQANKGDITGEKPGRLEFKAKAKYDAWASRKGMSQEEAMKAYSELVTKLENES